MVSRQVWLYDSIIQFNEDFLETKEFNSDLEKLHQEVALSPKANGRWLNFCRKYIFNTKMMMRSIRFI